MQFPLPYRHFLSRTISNPCVHEVLGTVDGMLSSESKYDNTKKNENISKKKKKEKEMSVVNTICNLPWNVFVYMKVAAQHNCIHS